MSIRCHNTGGSLTIKIHQLVVHVAQQVDTYGTVGLCSEDSAESIHAIVNMLARRYAALDSNRRSIQVMRALDMRKRTSAAKLSSKKAHGKDINEKRKRVQGSGASHPVDAQASIDLPSSKPPLLFSRSHRSCQRRLRHDRKLLCIHHAWEPVLLFPSS